MPDEQRLFVGREKELAALKEAIARPEGKLILVLGEVGVGKSALLEELAVRVDGTDDWVAVPYQLNENDSSESFLPRLMGDLLNVDGVTSGKFLWNAPGQIEKVKGFLSAVAKLPSLPGLGEAESLSGLIQILLPDDKRPPREKFVIFLRYAASRLKDGQRLVLIFDPDKYLDKSQEPDWSSLARDIPDRVTVLFAQRPDDVLAESEALLTSPKMQRIPEEPLGHLPREKSDELIAAGWQQKDGWRKLAAKPPADLRQVLWDKYDGWPLPLTMVLDDLPQEPEALEELMAAAQDMPKRLRDLLSLRYGKAAAEGDDAVRLLQGLAVLDRPATAERVAALCGEGCTAAGLTAAANQPAVTKCLSPGGKGLLDLFHATMGECVLDQMSDDAKRDLHRRAASLYEEDLEKNKSDREALDRLPYHLRHAGEAARFVEAVIRLHEDKLTLRMLHACLSDCDQALNVIDVLVVSDPAGYRGDAAGVSNNRGNVLQALGDRRGACRAFESALRVFRQLATEDASNERHVAGTLDNLGNALRALGERQKARQAHEEALAIRRRLDQAEPGAFTCDVAVTLNNLGIVLSDLGERAQARQACEEALGIYQKLAKANPAAFARYVASAAHNLGNALYELGQRVKARQAFDEALAIRRKLAQAEPAAFEPDVAMTLNNLGTVLSDLGERAQARQAFEEALPIYRDLAKAEPAAFLPDVAMTLNNLGTVLRDLGDRAQARQAHEEALPIYRDLAKAEPAAFLPDVAGTLNSLGNVLSDLGDRAQARQALEEALASYRKLTRADLAAFEPDLAMTLNNLGNVLRDLGERAQARQTFEEALAIRRKLAKAEPAAFEPDLAMTLNNLGNVLRELGEATRARQACEGALAIFQKLAQAEPAAFEPDLAVTLNNLGNVLDGLDQWARARQAYEKALLIYRRLAQVEPAAFELDLAMTLNNLGLALCHLEKWAEARSACDEALRIYTRYAKTEPKAFAGYLQMVARNVLKLLKQTGEKPEDWPALVEAMKLLKEINAAEQEDTLDES